MDIIDEITLEADEFIEANGRTDTFAISHDRYKKLLSYHYKDFNWTTKEITIRQIKFKDKNGMHKPFVKTRFGEVYIERGFNIIPSLSRLLG